MLRDPFWSQATVERHSTGTRQSTRVVPTRCRRGAGGVLTGLPRWSWVLDGSLGVCVRLCVRVCACNERVRVHGFVCMCRSSVCVVNGRGLVRARVAYARARACACMCPRTRAFVSACAGVRASPPDCTFARCVFDVCVRSERVCAPRRCARTLVARRRRAVFIARPPPRFAAARVWLRSVPAAGLARVGRRCHLQG